MLNNKTIAVVVPAYNEETQISMVIESMPEFVDRIIIVNDKSTDKTVEVVIGCIDKAKQSAVLTTKTSPLDFKGKFNRANRIVYQQYVYEKKFFTPSEVVNNNLDTDRIILINHTENGGVGAAIATGYKWCKDYNIDCTAVMAGDGQMDPDELESICSPVVYENIDYVKGNRLIHRSASIIIPKVRFFGNSILSILTKIASGYWHVSDTQTGYTAISLRALQSIKIYDIYKSYGMPNDLLVKLNISFCTLREVEIKPVYNVGEKSKMKVSKVIRRVSWLLFKLFFKRLWVKYLFRDFHPLFLLYHLSFLMIIISIPYLFRIIHAMLLSKDIGILPVLAFLFLFISGFQFLLFAMWMDMQDNERLNK